MHRQLRKHISASFRLAEQDATNPPGHIRNLADRNGPPRYCVTAWRMPHWRMPKGAESKVHNMQGFLNHLKKNVKMPHRRSCHHRPWHWNHRVHHFGCTETKACWILVVRTHDLPLNSLSLLGVTVPSIPVRMPKKNTVMQTKCLQNLKKKVGTLDVMMQARKFLRTNAGQLNMNIRMLFHVIPLN